MAPTIAYWPVRALVEPILLTMKQADQPYQLKTYSFGNASNYLGDEWPKDKYNLDLIYPNIPYFIDGDVRITQSLAILRYIGRKYGLGPETEIETIRCDIIEQGVMEINDKCFLSSWYAESNEAFESGNRKLKPYLEQKLRDTSKFLSSSNYLLGDKVTFVDFLLYSTLDYIRLFDSSYLDNHQNLKDFLDRIESLPRIKKYLESDDFKRFPITGPMAYWGNKKP